jgi:predicted RNase H-like HicB family nuclease
VNTVRKINLEGSDAVPNYVGADRNWVCGQVPDLAIITFGADIEAAKRGAREAIQIKHEGYRKAGQSVPAEKPLVRHLKNPDFRDLLFAYIDVPGRTQRAAA